MKRINPQNEKPFKRGDVREDGFVFFAYTKIIKADGFFKEIWLNPKSSENLKAKDRDLKKATYKRKSDRKPPGWHNLSLRQKNVVELLKQIESDGDWPEKEIVESLVGLELDLGPLLDEAIRFAQPLSFNAKELFRKSLEL